MWSGMVLRRASTELVRADAEPTPLHRQAIAPDTMAQVIPGFPGIRRPPMRIRIPSLGLLPRRAALC
jgi:hypothetical protein